MGVNQQGEFAVDNEQDMLCPILAAGGIANPKNVIGAPIGCWAEECEFWDIHNDSCFIWQIMEGQDGN